MVIRIKDSYINLLCITHIDENSYEGKMFYFPVSYTSGKITKIQSEDKDSLIKIKESLVKHWNYAITGKSKVKKII